MANRGAFTQKVGDPIYLIEMHFVNNLGTATSVKIVPSVAGLKSSVAALREDLKAGRLYGGGLVAFAVYEIEHPQWVKADPALYS